MALVPPDRLSLANAYMDDLMAAYERGATAGLTAQELADFTISRAFAVLQLTFDFDEQQFWRAVAVVAKNYVVSGNFRETRDAPGPRMQ